MQNTILWQVRNIDSKFSQLICHWQIGKLNLDCKTAEQENMYDLWKHVSLIDIDKFPWQTLPYSII